MTRLIIQVGGKEKAVQDQVEQFLRSLRDEKGYSNNTIDAYRNDLRQFVTFLDQSTAGSVGSWADVDTRLVQMYGTYLRERAYAASTVARKVASVKSFFSHLLDSAHRADNPADVLSVPRVKKQVPRVMSINAVQRLLAEPKKGATPKMLRDRALLELLYATGMRVSEIIPLRLGDLDAAGPHIACAGRDGKPRHLPLPPQAFESLSIYLEKGRDALVQDPAEMVMFVNQRGRPLTRQGLWLIIKSHAEAAGLGPNVTPHTLRHSCAAHRLAQGADIQRVRELLGHANISTTQVYVDIYDPADEKSDVDPS